MNPSVSKGNTITYKPHLMGDREYLGTITSLLLNVNYSSALVNSRIQLHYLGDSQKTIPESFVDKESKLFPEPGEKYTIMTQALSEEFLFFATSEFELKIYSLSEWKFVSNYKHSDKIKSIYPDIYGICLILIEMNNSGFLYHTAMDYLLPIPEFPAATEQVLWDTVPADRNVFVCCTKTSVLTYLFMPNYFEGPKVVMIGSTTIQSAQSPVLLTKGMLTIVSSSNKPMDITLDTHKTTIHNPAQTLDISLQKTLKLLNWKEAWNICAVQNLTDSWRRFAEACLQNIEFTWAIRAYQSLDEASMVWCLESLIEEEEDTSILCGHVAALLGNHDIAQQRYLTSDEPTMALTLRRDLRQWREALALATSLSSEQTPLISCDYAQQLEMTGQYAQALSYYQKCLDLTTPEQQDNECQRKCKEGIARTSIRVGDFRLGIRLAAESNSSVLKNECADILQQFNKLNDAVTLYESANNYEKAATCYIQLKNWTKIGQLLPHVKSVSTFIQYAKAREAMGNFKESVDAYERAEDYDNVVRVDLDHLNDIRHAVDTVNAKKCVEGAKRIADYCNKHGDFGAAIHFLILSKCYQDAFLLSQEHKKVHEFGKYLLEEDEPNTTELKRLAVYFEEEKDTFRAAQYYYHAKEYGKAMKLLLATARQNKDSDEILWLGVSIVNESHDEKLVAAFRGLLEGKLDGTERHPKFLYRVFMNQGDYLQASTCALAVARDDATRGNYRNCHETLFSTIQELKKHGLQVGNDLMAGLMLIHSYLLARYHVRNSNHDLAAPLLVRVAESISFFPLHAPSILTSTVIECKKANLKESALKFATLLLRPEYRNNMEDKYRKQIELIVRKAPRMENVSIEELSLLPCPYCDTLLPDMTLHCSSCSRIIPFCIASGKHITSSEITQCPECNFPAFHRHLIMIVEQEGFCPLCRTDLRGRPLPNDVNIKEL
uniref:WD repeat-containing protein 19 n=1 Tax=Cacopsylla melanoneura TaxID=428564 RepID=A0A8D9BEH2_9HEMI